MVCSWWWELSWLVLFFDPFNCLFFARSVQLAVKALSSVIGKTSHQLPLSDKSKIIQLFPHLLGIKALSRTIIFHAWGEGVQKVKVRTTNHSGSNFEPQCWNRLSKMLIFNYSFWSRWISNFCQFRYTLRYFGVAKVGTNVIFMNIPFCWDHVTISTCVLWN